MAFDLSKRPNVKVGITMEKFCREAERLGVLLPVIRAVDEVESAGSGFFSDGRPKILCERHYFYKIIKNTHGLAMAEKARRMDSSVCNPKMGGHIGGRAEYGRLAKMTEICHELKITDGIALRSASWGRYQIMGENFHKAGFKTVFQFVEAMFFSEDNHLEAFVNYIQNEMLDDELQNLPSNPRKYAEIFARAYNGPAYKRNNYHVKIPRAYEKFRKMKVDCSQTKTQDEVIDVIPGERPEEVEAGFAGTSLDDRYSVPSSGDVSPSAPEDGGRDQNGGSLPIKTEVEVSETGSVHVQTEGGPAGQKEKIAIEKPEPVGFWKGLWQRIVAAAGTNITFEVAADKAQQVGALGLSAETWTWIGWIVLAGTVIALCGYIYVRRQEKKREEMVTQLLIEANSEEGNYVQLVDKDLLPLYEQQGYKIITR